MSIKELEGKILKNIIESDSIIFECESGERYIMEHQQDCCESVYIEDITGDLQGLIGQPIILAEEVENEEYWGSKFSGEDWNNKNEDGEYYPESHTWTFYKISNIHTDVTIRWFGESNGYYSEGVDFQLLKD